jgi:hypothetical protein
VLGSREGAAAAHQLEIGRSLSPATISGDPRLIARLVSNLGAASRESAPVPLSVQGQTTVGIG